jgi:transcriptional regulator NrdR family protein
MNRKKVPLPNEQVRGIRCPLCGCREWKTTHTEPTGNGRIRRRKTCRHCGRKIVTFEVTPGALAR